jgi:hypothetical protein
MAKATLKDGRVIKFPDGLPPDRVKMIIQKASKQQQTAQPEAPLNWADVPGQALQNAPASALEFGKALVQPILHPVDTANNLANLGGGALAKIPGVSAVNDWAERVGIAPPRNRAAEAQNMELAGNVGQFFKDRYGSEEGLKRTLAQDPVGAAADVSTVLTGGAGLLARAPGTAARVTSGALLKAGKATNPMTPAIAPVGLLKNRSKSKAATKEVLDKAPEFEEVARQADDLYAAVKAKNIQFPANTFKPAVKKLKASFEGIDKNVAPNATALKNSLIEILPPMKVGPPTSVNMYGHVQHNKPIPDTRTIPLNKIENVRKAAATAARDSKLSDTERMGAGKVVSAIEEYYKTIPGLSKEMAPAREMARREILAKQLKKMQNKSEWYLSGDESGLRNQVSAFGKREGQGLTPAEKAAFKKLVRREGLNNLLTTSGGRLAQLIFSGAGVSAAGLPGLLGGLAVHSGARKLSEARTLKALKEAEKTVLLGKEGQKNLTKKGLLAPKQRGMTPLLLYQTGRPSTAR